ncbi:MAG: FAD-binding oxidoreductase, partial [Armatimonadota bacterium]
TGLGSVVAQEFADMTITVDAGVALPEVQARMATRGQFLTLEPGDSASATVGGMLAVDARSDLALGYGKCRDWLIGVEAVDAEGRVVRGGGRVVKNVSGYDLPKLYTGSLGTLAVLTQATFKVAPIPEAVRTLAVRLDNPVSGPFLEDLRQSVDPVAAILFAEPGATPHFIALFHGAMEAVEGAAGLATELARRHQVGPAGVYSEDLVPARLPVPLEMAISGKSAEVPALFERLRREVGESGAVVIGRVGVGDVRLRWSHDDDAARSAMQRVRAIATVEGLRSTLLHAPADMRVPGEPDVWLPLPASMSLQRMLKDTLDPAGILNPGRFLGRI